MASISATACWALLSGVSFMLLIAERMASLPRRNKAMVFWPAASFFRSSALSPEAAFSSSLAAAFSFFDVRPLPAHGSLPEVGFGHKNPLPPFLKRVLHQINDFEAEDFIDISITLPGLSGDICAGLVGVSMKMPDGVDDGFSPFGTFLGFRFGTFSVCLSTFSSCLGTLCPFFGMNSLASGLSFGRVDSKHLLRAEFQKLLFGKSPGGGGFSFYKGILLFRQ